jgi:hypothetical protein
VPLKNVIGIIIGGWKGGFGVGLVEAASGDLDPSSGVDDVPGFDSLDDGGCCEKAGGSASGGGKPNTTSILVVALGRAGIPMPGSGGFPPFALPFTEPIGGGGGGGGNAPIPQPPVAATSVVPGGARPESSSFAARAAIRTTCSPLLTASSTASRPFTEDVPVPLVASPFGGTPPNPGRISGARLNAAPSACLGFFGARALPKGEVAEDGGGGMPSGWPRGCMGE